MRFNPVPLVSIFVFITILSACKSSKEYYSWQRDALYPESGELAEGDDEDFYEIPVKKIFKRQLPAIGIYCIPDWTLL